MSKTTPSAEDNLECYSQACEEARHYGKLRFTMATWGIAISWGLIALALGKDFQNPAGWLAALIPIAGIVLAMSFMAAERRFSKLVRFYQEEARRLRLEFGYHGFELLPDHDRWIFFARATILAPQVFAFMFWVSRLIGILASR